MTPAEQRHLAGIRAGLSRVARYDDESIVNDKWVRQRYDCGCFPSFAPARKAAVRAAWLPTWKGDGGDARHFRRALGPRFGRDELRAWRYSETTLVPLRPKIAQVARALLIHPRHLPCGVVAAIAGERPVTAAHATGG